jgi:hypothetical protein
MARTRAQVPTRGRSGLLRVRAGRARPRGSISLDAGPAQDPRGRRSLHEQREQPDPEHDSLEERPVGVPSGIERASAAATAPRRPVQFMTWSHASGSDRTSPIRRSSPIMAITLAVHGGRRHLQARAGHAGCRHGPRGGGLLRARLAGPPVCHSTPSRPSRSKSPHGHIRARSISSSRWPAAPRWPSPWFASKEDEEHERDVAGPEPA